MVFIKQLPDLAGKPVNETSYRGTIGSLMYLTETRHDIQFSTVLCARYHSNPNNLLLNSSKKKHQGNIKGTPTLGLYYLKCSGFDLKGYSDLDYAGCNMDRKSTLGSCQILGEKLYHMDKSQLSDYDIHYKMVPIFCDNTSAIAISNNPVLHSRTKHIDIRYHFIRDHILKGDIELQTSFPPLISTADSNFLREFWSTVVAYDPFPSTDEIEQRPVKEFLIKFSVLNGQRPLTLDFNTFCSSIGLDYNNGKYVAHPTPEAVKKELGKITINPSYLDKTLVLKNSFPVAWRILFTFVIQGPEASRALSKKIQKPKSKKPPTETKINIQLASTGLPSILDEGTHKSQPLPEGPATHPKDSGGNIQPFDRDLTSTTFAEGTAKTMPRTGAKYQMDETQSTRLRYRSLTKNKGKTSSEVEPDTEALQLQTFVDVQAFLISEDELDIESDEEEVLAAGEDMDEDP
ncbi:hypothetical protein Tco_0059847 [Tanacetum coccineum]